MFKKVILTLGCIFSINAMAADFNSPEYVAHQDKLFKIDKTELIKTDDVRYEGNDIWFLIKETDKAIYYAQKDPISDVISKIRVISEYKTFTAGQELKFLEDKFGKPQTIFDHVKFSDEEKVIKFSVESNPYDNTDEKSYEIVEIIYLEGLKEKSVTEKKIYDSEFMIRQ